MKKQAATEKMKTIKPSFAYQPSQRETRSAGEGLPRRKFKARSDDFSLESKLSRAQRSHVASAFVQTATRKAFP